MDHRRLGSSRSRRRTAAALAALSLVVAACGGGGGGDGGPGTTPPEGPTLGVQVASYELVAERPNRLIVGLLAQLGPEDIRLVSWGEVRFDFAYLGTRDAPIEDGEAVGEAATAAFLQVPGEDGSTPEPRDRPTVTVPSEGRGVYAAYDLIFDRAGFYEVTVTADVAEHGELSGSGAFEVVDDPVFPAPGEPAPRTQNLTVDSPGAPPEAVDSRAQGGSPVPDPELHGTTIADAIDRGRPVLAVFSTPVWCQSRFCGPITDMIQGLAAEYTDRAEFVHVEIWRDFEQGVVNEAAAEWTGRGDGTFSEPWVFLVGADGTIVARWDNVVSAEELRPALESLPRS